MSVPPIEAVGVLDPTALARPQALAPPPSGAVSFERMLLDGVHRVNDQLREADALTRAFVLDDSIPVHQVTFALERARMSLELMLQVRARLVEGYQDLMRMQL